MEDALVADIIAWDVVTWRRALPLFERALPPDLAGRCCLELGARNGGLSLWLALKGAQVTCSYYGEEIAEARALHQAHGVAERVRYEMLDATSIPHKEQFDVIVLKSVIGGIGAGDRDDLQAQAIIQIYEALKPDGVFLFAENVTATPVHRILRERKRGDRWRYPAVDELREMLASFSDLDYFTTGVTACFGLSERQRQFLGHADGLIAPLVPDEWRYVMIGAARK